MLVWLTSFARSATNSTNVRSHGRPSSEGLHVGTALALPENEKLGRAKACGENDDCRHGIDASDKINKGNLNMATFIKSVCNFGDESRSNPVTIFINADHISALIDRAGKFGTARTIDGQSYLIAREDFDQLVKRLVRCSS